MSTGRYFVAIQCRPPTGEPHGCFIYEEGVGSGPSNGTLVSPVFSNGAPLYEWMHEKGYSFASDKSWEVKKE